SREPGVRRRVERAVAQALRLVEPPEQQSGTTQRPIAPAATGDAPPRRLTLEELLPFPEPGQRLARVAELREDPGQVGDRRGKVECDVPRSGHCNPVLDQ